jgi:tellurite methyltransferase
MSDGASWSDYYEENEGREPREMLLEVLARFPEPGDAVDLGCGSGIETLAMLQRGWRVFATDAEDEAIERLRARVPPDIAHRLRTSVSRMEDVDLPAADLLQAGFSLFFCRPDRFAEVWAKVGRSLCAGGTFVGQLLGERDTWAPEDDISSFSESHAHALFDGWTIERFEEQDEDGDSLDGPKHWHVFHVVARAPNRSANTAAPRAGTMPHG